MAIEILSKPTKWEAGCTKCGVRLSYEDSDVQPHNYTTMGEPDTWWGFRCPHCNNAIEVPTHSAKRKPHRMTARVSLPALLAQVGATLGQAMDAVERGER